MSKQQCWLARWLPAKMPASPWSTKEPFKHQCPGTQKNFSLLLILVSFVNDLLSSPFCSVFFSAQCISSPSFLLFPSLAQWEYHGSSDPREGYMEGGRQCQKEKNNATAPVLNYWKIIYHLHVANFYGDPFQNFDVSSPSKCSHQGCDANAVLFIPPNCICSFVPAPEFPKKIAQMYLSLSAFLFNNINTYFPQNGNQC